MSAADPLTFVQLPVALLLDDRAAGLSDAAWRLYTRGLLKAAAHSAHEGILWTDTDRAVDRWAALDGGPAAVGPATAELIAAGLWAEGPRAGRTVVVGFAERHDRAVSARRRGSKGAHQRHHAARGITSPSCEWCQADDAPAAPVPAVTAPADPEPAAPDGLAALRAALDAATVETAAPEAYVEVAAVLPELAAGLADAGLSEDRARQELLLHACRAWGIEVEGRAIGRVTSLGKRHGTAPALRALAHAAAAASGDPIAYATAILRREGAGR